MELLKLLGLDKDKKKEEEEKSSCEALGKGVFVGCNTTDNSESYFEKSEKYTPIIDKPTTNTYGYLRGIDTIRFRIKYDTSNIKSVILLIHQPRNHSFLHIVYDVENDYRFLNQHDGDVGMSMGNVTATTSTLNEEDGKEEIIIEWALSASCPLDYHAVETFVVMNNEVVKCNSKKVYIAENESKKILSKEDEIKVKKMLEQSNGVKDDISKKILEAFEIDKKPKLDVMPIGKTVIFG